MKRFSILLCIITLGVFMMAGRAVAQSSFSFPPKSFPTNVPFKCDAGVDNYWHVISVTCIGRANGGYKFRIKGTAQNTTRSLSINLFYLMPGNRIMIAGAYYFPSIVEGETFSFEIVSAFSGYTPSKFNGFLITSEVLQNKFIRESQKSKEVDNNVSIPESKTSDIGKVEETTEEVSKPKTISDKVYLSTDKGIEHLPEYPGGLRAFMNYISQNLTYPQICKKQKIEGKVLVGFIVEKDGSVSNVKALKKVHANLDAEAIRVVESLPKWKPGTINGEPVRVQMGVNVTFRL